MQLVTELITKQTELALLVEQINHASWDAGNGIDEYTVAALQSYLDQTDTVFIVCYLVEGTNRILAGIASARIEQKPYDHCKWLYVDEVDTCANFRRRGVATALMQSLTAIANENECEEIWLGAESRNEAANGFYQSLQPTAIDDVIGYTFEL